MKITKIVNEFKGNGTGDLPRSLRSSFGLNSKEVVGVPFLKKFCEINLPCGRIAILDRKDFVWASRYKWHVGGGNNRDNRYTYAVTLIWKYKMPTSVKNAEYQCASHIKKLRMHRLITGAQNGQFVDHINGNTLDNRRSNLRICTKAQNAWNTHARWGESKYKGVRFHSRNHRPYAVITANRKQIYLGMYDTEEFIVSTQTRFEMTDTLQNLLKIVGNVKEESVKTVVDDGISQEVTARAGMATVSNITLPNPVNLKPFKTFPEVNSPEVPHIFRGKSGPSWALFEGDELLWAVETKSRIAEWIARTSKLEVFI